MNRAFIIFLAMALLLAACSPAAAPTGAGVQPSAPSLPTAVPSTGTPIPTLPPSATAQPTATTPPTATPAPTDAVSPIPTEEQQQVLRAYQNMVLIQMNAYLLRQMAEDVQSGELEGFESFGALLVVGTLLQAVDESLPTLEVPEPFRPYWNDITAVHEMTMDVMQRWFNEEIDSARVLEEITPYTESMDELAKQAERDLAHRYGQDPAELTRVREELMLEIQNLFESTPTPQP